MDTYRQVFRNNDTTTGACLRCTSWVKQCSEHLKVNSRVDKCQVDLIVEMTPEEYEEFTGNLGESRTWLDKTGGSSSSVEFDKPSHQWTEAERQRWIYHSWRNVVAVTCRFEPTIYVDASGYDYARYVGLAA